MRRTRGFRGQLGHRIRTYTTQGWCLIGARRLPPTLNMQSVHPITSCSKASRGLFVQLRVKGIFTPLAVSPSPSSRQFPTRYAIRAGQNSPDKEFRYLRTVIVTAGVHQRLDSKLHALLRFTPPLNVLTLARHQPIYIALRLRMDLCFW